jgi:hypothetical protein
MAVRPARFVVMDSQLLAKRRGADAFCLQQRGLSFNTAR